jgi:hypothetical protein
MRRPAGAVGRALALRHDAFEPELAGVFEDGRAVLFDVLVELDTRLCSRQQLCQGSLALLDGIAPQIVAVQFHEVRLRPPPRR